MLDGQEGAKKIALLGNPNVGKSTLFNLLTGLRQHTGNWPGKTVELAVGECRFNDVALNITDLPGIYSLMTDSPEEEVTLRYILEEKPSLSILVADATNIERGISLLLQVLEITPNVILCINLIDEARRRLICVDSKKISQELGIPVAEISAGRGEGIDELLQLTVKALSDIDKAGDTGNVDAKNKRPVEYGPVLERAIDIISESLPKDLPRGIRRFFGICLLLGRRGAIGGANALSYFQNGEIDRALEDALNLIKLSGISRDDIYDRIAIRRSERAAQLAALGGSGYCRGGRRHSFRLDKVLSSRTLGVPIMLLLLMGIFWLTIVGANYPSELLGQLFSLLGIKLRYGLELISTPPWLLGLIVDGVWRTVSWIVAVMLPPMAIFFPLFGLLEDLGYLPRVAFNLDGAFYRCGACGRQALTMCMGLGCNAAGVVGCRIISSPRERLLAVLTNAFVPCNGRFPAMIAVITMFFGGAAVVLGGVYSAIMLTLVIALGVAITLFMSWLLSKTLLKGVPSFFTLELPPWRRPQVGKVLLRSLLDRTLFVLLRALYVAVPAGAIIYILANVQLAGLPLMAHISSFLEPIGQLMGLDGVIVLAFILGLPANEIVLPIVLMGYLLTGSLPDLPSLNSLMDILVNNGWSLVTAVSFILFSLCHFPCATTLMTIKKETGSVYWTAVSAILPTLTGFLLCCAVNLIFG